MNKKPISMIQLEEEIFNYINEIRAHPETFAKSLIKEDENPKIKNFLRSLSRFCIGKIPLLKKESLLQKCAKEMLTTIILHDNGTDIIKFTPQERENYRLKNRLKRIEQYGKNYYEFIVFDANNAEEIIKKIICNNNYQDKLFDPKMGICGIACEILPSNRVCSVIDLVDFFGDNNNQFQEDDEMKYRKKYETRSYNPNLNKYTKIIKEPEGYIYETEYKRNIPQYNKYGFNMNEKLEDLKPNYRPYSNRTYNNRRIETFENREELNNSDDNIVYSNNESNIIINPLEDTEGFIDNTPLKYSTRTTPIKKYNFPFEQKNKQYHTNTYNYNSNNYKNSNISTYENKEIKSLFSKQKPGVTYQEKIIPDVDGSLINVMAKKTVFEDGYRI